MNNDEYLEKITDIVRDALDDDDITLNLQTAASDVPGWDSLAHIRIVVAVEREFGVRFSTEQITNLKNVGDLIRLVANIQS